MRFQFPVFLHSFRSVEPPYRIAQADALAWLTEAYSIATRRKENGISGFLPTTDSLTHPQNRFEKMVHRFSCPETKIGHRASFLSDYSHTAWDKMKIFRLVQSPRGAWLGERMKFYSETVGPLVEDLLSKRRTSRHLSEILHVSCTGYESPSAVQKWAARYHPSARTTHVYHMGCYAALPAIRLAALTVCHQANSAAETEIVHTELCTLHFDPTDCSPSQIVVQSLFADGAIAYTASGENGRPPATAAMEVIAEREELLPDSDKFMTWVSSEFGMQMTLSREVPDRIFSSLSPFVTSLCAEAGLEFTECKARLIFAVHPGGPRIVEGVQDLFRLDDAQVKYSRKVLYERGNLSSATLPYIWDEIARSGDVAPGTLVVSLAFGPGLTVCGAILRKVRE